MGKPWRDPKALREQYVEQGKTLAEVAEALGCSSPTVNKWLRRYGIEIRAPASERDYSGRSSPRFVNYARFETNGDGYETWRSRTDGRAYVSVHRLAAVAWFGYETVAENDVHHLNGVPWDNRESNLDPLDPNEHRSRHAQERERDSGRFA
jgi:biotin operon repressor